MTSVRARKLFKVFGPRPEEVVALLDEGASDEDVRASGCTAAVIDADFTVREGETFVVMGLSGSGKSTLIRMLNGLLTPTSGEVGVDDDILTALSPAALRAMRTRTMSMVFQHFALFPHRTVLDNAGYGLRVRGLDRQEIDRAARDALRLVGLDGWENRYPQQLSGGMRQRVGLARALAAGTDVLLMDEAFSALDPLIKREMQDQLLELQSRLGKTIIFITHDLNEAMRLGDRIAVMRAGRIVQIGTAEHILSEPADDYVTRFVEDVDRARVLTAGNIVSHLPTPAITDTPDHAARLMREQDADRILVVDQQHRPAGLVTGEALAHATDHDSLHGLLTHAPAEVPGHHTLRHLFTRFAHGERVLPVVDRAGRLIGPLTAHTLITALSAPEPAAQRSEGGPPC